MRVLSITHIFTRLALEESRVIPWLAPIRKQRCADGWISIVAGRRTHGQHVRGWVGRVGESLPMACQDWAATKAAYGFLSNDRVSEAEILAGHFQATRDRFVAHDGPVLVLQDTTEFSFKREGLAARLASPQA